MQDSFKIFYFPTVQYLPGLRPIVFLNGYFKPKSTTIARGTYKIRHVNITMNTKYNIIHFDNLLKY